MFIVLGKNYHKALEKTANNPAVNDVLKNCRHLRELSAVRDIYRRHQVYFSVSMFA